MLSIESQWTHDRIKLYKLHRANPTCTRAKLAEKTGYSVTWVKKWLKRFQQTTIHTLDSFTSQSHAPYHA